MHRQTRTVRFFKMKKTSPTKTKKASVVVDASVHRAWKQTLRERGLKLGDRGTMLVREDLKKLAEVGA